MVTSVHWNLFHFVDFFVCFLWNIGLLCKDDAFSSSDQFLDDTSITRPGVETSLVAQFSSVAELGRNGASGQPNASQYLCNNCGKSFGYKRSLQRHEWRCLKLRRLQCHVCDHVSYRMDYHKQHLSNIHGVYLLE